MKNLVFFSFLVLFSFFAVRCKKPITNINSILNDSINIWINKTKNEELDLNKKKQLLQKAYSKTLLNKNDSLKAINLSSIAYRYYKLNDSINFFKINKEAFGLAKKINNSYILGDVHWSFANFHKTAKKFEQAYYHFNNAHKYFQKTDNTDNSAIMLYGMAFIKGRYRDYSGSEILTIEAIKNFNQTKNNKRLFSCYNHLGLLQNDIKEYDKALEYYNKSLSYLIKLDNKNSEARYISLYTNIGNTYLKKKEYKKAIEFYNKALKKEVTPNSYAITLDNRAYCKLLSRDTLNIKSELFKALSIRDSLKNIEGLLTSKTHISDYYKYINDTLNALSYAKEANNIAKKLKNGRDYLTTLNQLANLDTKNSKKYLDSYIEFNDSLISAERRIQNKFTRIEFETDEYIEETKRLSQQRIWILITSFAGILILSLLYFLGVQKAKNEKLSLESEQQKANEEVYILTLQQQAKLEEEKIKERNRISEELHDGILGKLFGTRFGLGFLNIQGDEEVLEKHQTLLNELQDIEKEIRDVSHKLSDNFDGSNINFTSIIEQLLKDKSEIGNFKYQFISDENISWKSIDEITKANVYRIIQEALQNIIKHAEAKNITLSLSTDTHNLIIHLKDDGKGFNVKKKKTGIGIKNINSRIKKLKGTVQLDSEINNGTLLSLTIPLKS